MGVIRGRSSRLVTAWLGLLAMCLVAFMPVASQLFEAYGPVDPADYICSVSGSHENPHKTHSSTALSACGYCDFLAGHPTVPALPKPLIPQPIAVMVITVPAHSSLFIALGTFPSGRPRDPPAQA